MPYGADSAIIGAIVEGESCKMSVARYGFQELQNGLRRGEKVKEGSNYTERSNAYIKMQRNQCSNAKANC